MFYVKYLPGTLMTLLRGEERKMCSRIINSMYWQCFLSLKQIDANMENVKFCKSLIVTTSVSLMLLVESTFKIHNKINMYNYDYHEDLYCDHTEQGYSIADIIYILCQLILCQEVLSCEFQSSQRQPSLLDVHSTLSVLTTKTFSRLSQQFVICFWLKFGKAYEVLLPVLACLHLTVTLRGRSSFSILVFKQNAETEKPS